MQLFDFKTKYMFQTQPGVDQYNMPLYNIQTEPSTPSGTQNISFYPVYQGFLEPCYINGYRASFTTLQNGFFDLYPNIVQQQFSVGIGNGTAGPYTLNFPISPIVNFPPGTPEALITRSNSPEEMILRGHVDINGIIATGVNQDPPFGSTINPLIPSTSILPAVYITSSDTYGNNVVIQDSGQFMAAGGANYANFGLLMAPGTAPFGYTALPGGYVNSFAITGVTQASSAVITATTTFAVGQTVTINNVAGMTQLNGNTYTITAVSPTTITINVDSTGFTAYTSGGTVTSLQNYINYLTGIASNVFFPAIIPVGENINVQCFFFQTGLPRQVLFYNNTLVLRSPPDTQYLVEVDAYLSPAAFFSTGQSVPFAYMSEYLARGAARKILADTGDVEQFMFYEPLFKEQEMLVWKRSQRQFTASRTPTIYSQGFNNGQSGGYNYGGVGSS
jgi:ubiquitin-activating enzyme E1-like protein